MNADVSIIIPVKNAEKNISKTLSIVLNQKTNFSFEVMVIDGGSTDGTQEIVKNFPQVTLVQIKPEEFGHGRTRNLGAKMASGEYLVYLNGDAIPKDEYWLEKLLENFKDNEQVAGVYSRHLPKDECYFFVAQGIYEMMPPVKMVKKISNILDGDIERYPDDFFRFSTVSCVIKKKLWQEMPFNETLPLGEDTEWAKRTLEMGYSIVYEPSSVVLHSHNYTFRGYYKQYCDFIRISSWRIKKTKLELFFEIIFFPVSVLSSMIYQIMYLKAEGHGWKRVLKELGLSFSLALAELLGDISVNISE